jgi:hypothetical protein
MDVPYRHPGPRRSARAAVRAAAYPPTMRWLTSGPMRRRGADVLCHKPRYKRYYDALCSR